MVAKLADAHSETAKRFDLLFQELRVEGAEFQSFWKQQTLGRGVA